MAKLSFTFQGRRFTLGQDSISVDKNESFTLPALRRSLNYWFENEFASQEQKSLPQELSAENSSVDHYQFHACILQ
ncbi:MAG: hypothetical protein JWN25_1379 [Verrucomicrobiales bacterium]|nr:hypothetical protein [Verrucomicrobiales bacterium]